MNKQKTKIAIVANSTWNIYNFRLNVVEMLLKENFEVIVIAPVDKYIHYKEKYPEVTHVPLKKLNRDSLNPWKDIKLIFELTKIYKRLKPDLIIHYTVKPNVYGGIAAKLNNIASLAVVTGLGYTFIHNGFVKKITKLLYRLTSGFHKKIIFENIDDRLLFVENGLIEETKGISIKGCGVDSAFFSPMPNGVLKEKTTFTFIGRLLYDKGVKEFVEAAKIIKEKSDKVDFWLVGEIDKNNPAAIKNDDLNDWVKEKVVVYHGSTNDVRKYIADSDCIVLPSYREAIARSITEGMAMEKPVITTDTPGCREAVENGKNGYLVPIKNVKALSNSMEQFLQLNHDQRHIMGALGRKKVLNEFDDKLIANQIVDIIKSNL